MERRWITDFLSNRTLTVFIRGKSSQPSEVLSGLPQGSVLGPLLFILYEFGSLWACCGQRHVSNNAEILLQSENSKSFPSFYSVVTLHTKEKPYTSKIRRN